MIFFIFIMLSVLLFGLNLLFSFKINYGNKITNFECGFESLFKVNLSFSIHFFFIMLIFIIFDLEVLMLIGLMMGDSNFLFSFLFIFFFILFGLYLEWYFGKLVWFY